MAGLNVCSCVSTKVPVSYSFQSLSVPAPNYDPGLTSITLRIYSGKSRLQHRSSSSSDSSDPSPQDDQGEVRGGGKTTGYGEMRLVHANTDVCRLVEAAVNKHWPDLNKSRVAKDNENTEDIEGEQTNSPDNCFWSLITGASVLESDTRVQLMLDLFSGLASASWQILNSTSLTLPPTTGLERPHMFEVFTWIIKKQPVPVPGIDTIAVRLTVPLDQDEDQMEYTVFAPRGGNNVEVNNILRSAIESAKNKTSSASAAKSLSKTPSSDGELVDKSSTIRGQKLQESSGTKTNESGYISEEDKKSEDEDKKSEDEAESSNAQTSTNTKPDAQSEETSNVVINVVDSSSQDDDVETAEEAVESEDHNAADKKVDATDDNDKPAAKDDQNDENDELNKHTKEDVKEMADTKHDDNETKASEESKKGSEESNKDSSTQEDDEESSRGIVLRNKGLLMEKLFGGQQQHLAGGGHAGRRTPTPTFRESQEDPTCPNRFFMPRGDDHVTSVLLDLSLRMFTRQWKLVAGPCLHVSHETVLLFEHDSRILPGIGQQLIAGVSIMEVEEEEVEGVKGDSVKKEGMKGDSVKKEGMKGETVRRGLRVKLHNVDEEVAEYLQEQLRLKIRESPGDSQSQVIKENVALVPEDEEWFLSHLVFSLSHKSFSLYRSVQVKDGVLLMFRANNLIQSSAVTLRLHKGNVVRLLGGHQAEVDIIREVIRSRWPYPLQDDRRINCADQPTADLPGAQEHKKVPEKSQKANDKEDQGEGEDQGYEKIELDHTDPTDKLDWEWRVLRYPWRVSYGVKLVDRALQRVGRLLSLPSPKHQDLESAKSLIIFCIKELSEEGWRFIGGYNVHHETYLQFIK